MDNLWRNKYNIQENIKTIDEDRLNFTKTCNNNKHVVIKRIHFNPSKQVGLLNENSNKIFVSNDLYNFMNKREIDRDAFKTKKFKKSRDLVIIDNIKNNSYHSNQKNLEDKSNDTCNSNLYKKETNNIINDFTNVSSKEMKWRKFSLNQRIKPLKKLIKKSDSNFIQNEVNNITKNFNINENSNNSSHSISKKQSDFNIFDSNKFSSISCINNGENLHNLKLDSNILKNNTDICSNDFSISKFDNKNLFMINMKKAEILHRENIIKTSMKTFMPNLRFIVKEKNLNKSLSFYPMNFNSYKYNNQMDIDEMKFKRIKERLSRSKSIKDKLKRFFK